jgi:hypothetical protein
MTTEKEIDEAGREWSTEFRADIEDFLAVRGRSAGKIDLIDEIALWQGDDSTSQSRKKLPPKP